MRIRINLEVDAGAMAWHKGVINEGEAEMLNEYKVTIKGETGTISYTVFKTLKGAKSFGNKVAGEAFFGESVSVEVEEV